MNRRVLLSASLTKKTETGGKQVILPPLHIFLYLSNLCNKLSNTIIEGETTVLCALNVLSLCDKKGYQLKVMHRLTNVSALKNVHMHSLQQKHLQRNCLEMRLELNFILSLFSGHVAYVVRCLYGIC